MKQLWQKLKQMSRAHLPQYEAPSASGSPFCNPVNSRDSVENLENYCIRWETLSVIVHRGPQADVQKEQKPFCPVAFWNFYLSDEYWGLI